MTVCPRCGEENPERARFCLACGLQLESIPASGEERKVVSILFVDLAGFTASSEDLDPEDVRARLRPYHARVKREIEYFGGTVEKFVGDAILAAFGAPVAHEDDAERAVRAGLRTLEAIEELNQAEPRLELSVRAAVNSGEAVVTLDARPAEGQSFVTGDVVNTASRLQQAADVGTLVVGEQTFHMTKHAIDYDELEPVSVKGKAAPLSLWRAKSARDIATDDEREGPWFFVGRQHEIALLKDMYARTQRESFIQLVTLTGEAGVGKSRLVGEFRSSVEESTRAIWRRGRCLPYGEGITFWALGEIVKAQTGVLESDSPEEVSRKLAAAVTRLIDEPSERAWFEARLGPLVGAGTADDEGAVERSQSFTAWRRFLEAIASKSPLVLVFEDLHWADAAMVDFIEHLVDWSSGVPLLVICTARPEIYERRTGWGGGKRNSTTVALAPLTAKDTARLIGLLLAQAVLPVETQVALLERSGGNPLYAKEFVRMLGDRGILQRRGSVLEIGADAEIPVPETVEALIAARLDTLSQERKALLQAAAVVGKQFWAGAVASVAGVSVTTAEETLNELARKEFVRRVHTSSVQGEEEYSFWHVLVRDVAYRQIPRAARAAVHRSSAEWIERTSGERVTDHAEFLAHHYCQALELTRAMGAETADLEAQASRFLVLAGDRALRLDIAKALSYYRRALKLLPVGGANRGHALAGAAEATALAGRTAEAEVGYGEAIAEFRAQANDSAAGEALVKLAVIARDRGETELARSLLAEAVELLERVPPGPELILAYTQTARYHHFQGPPEQCLEWAEKAITTAKELGIEGHAVRARLWREFTRFARADVGALDELRETLRIGLESGLEQDRAAVYLGILDVAWWSEGPDAGLDVYRAGINFTERRGMTYYAMYLKGESVWPLFDSGRWDELLQIAKELVDWDRTSYQALLALPYAAQVRLLREQVASADALREEFLPRARDSADPQVVVPALATSALIEKRRGDLAAAVALAEEYAAITNGRPVWRAQHLLDVLRTCAAAGAVKLGESLVDGMRATAARQLNTLHTARAVLAEARGDFEEAVRLYAESVERWAEFGFVLEQGQALLGVGRCLVALEDRATANPSLQKARDIFTPLECRALVAEAESLLAQTAFAS
jgi:class 3 adenylate cyclase/tetratricopeptide (TPR) repeat protein